MKKFILFLSFSLSVAFAKAQISIPKVDVSKEAGNALGSFVKPPAIGDVGKTTSGITDLLGSKLSLGGSEKSQISGLVDGFLGQKKGIIGLASSNPTGYLAKFNPLQQGLFGKMKGIMGAAKFASFLKLKPSGSGIGGNLLSNLFF